MIDVPQQLAVPSLGGNGESWIPQSPDEREAILKQLNRILTCPVFRNSKRYPALLKFIVDETLEGRGDLIKERILGIEVFGREPGYDTNSDHVVRTAAGEVRRRLAQYYLEYGQSDEIRIEVPSGSYVAQFRIAAPSRELPALAPVPAEVEPQVTARPRWVRLPVPFTISLLVNALLLITVAVGNKWINTKATTLDQFWDPLFTSSNPLLICVGLRDGYGRAGAPGGQPATNQPAQTANPAPAAAATPGASGFTNSADRLMHRVSMADLLSLARVANYAGERGSQFKILDPNSTSFADLRNEPTVLIGVGNNDWTKQITDRLRFTFVSNGNRPVQVFDKQNPGRTDWTLPAPWNEQIKDYAVVSRILDPRLEQMIVIIGGLGPHGTESAGEFVTNPVQMRKLDGYLPSGWARKNLQIVLSTEVVKGSSGPPKIESVYVW